MATSNLRPVSLAWLDANVYNTENKEILKKLNDMFTDCIGFVEEDECKRYLGRGVHDPRRFILIVSGQLGQKFVPQIHEHSNILSIYVYCGNAEWHKQWAQAYSNVKVITATEELLSKLKSDKDRYESV